MSEDPIARARSRQLESCLSFFRLRAQESLSAVRLCTIRAGPRLGCVAVGGLKRRCAAELESVYASRLAHSVINGTYKPVCNWQGNAWPKTM
jgi:hypothetical protein